MDSSKQSESYGSEFPLFENFNSTMNRPLAERVRPKAIDQMVGQKNILGEGAPWYRQLESSLASGRVPSFILFGPPGCGKTTLAKIISQRSKAYIENCPAIEVGAKVLKDVCEKARHRRLAERLATLVFIDEIHRLNRSQQDVLLAALESGDVSLLGATTENPSHALNPALISRCQVLRFESLNPEALLELAQRGFRELGCDFEKWLTPDGWMAVLSVADGDGRKVLNTIEWLVAGNQTADKNPLVPLSAEQVSERVGVQTLKYDRLGDMHYDSVSAFIKSIRGSNPDAALYYLARLSRAEEDVAFIARRLMILASEDIGNADPRALQLAASCFDGVTRVGWPEAGIIFAQVVVYLACAPKSNSSYKAYQKALDVVDQTGSLPIPLALRSSRTKLSKQLGYGKGYRYSHEGERGYIDQEFFPDSIANAQFLELTDRGFEKTLAQYQTWIKKPALPR